MGFRGLVGQSFTVIWRHKQLWLLGILVSLFGNGPLINYSPDEGRIVALFQRLGQSIGRLSGAEIGLILALITLLILVGIFLSFAFRGALVELVIRARKGDAVLLGPGVDAGVRYALRLLAKSLLLWGPFYIILALAAGFILSRLLFALSGELDASELDIAFLFYTGALAGLFFAVLGIYISIVNCFADRLIIAQDAHVVASLREAGSLVRSYAGRSLLAWCIMFAVTVFFLVGLVVLVFAVYAIVAALLPGTPVGDADFPALAVAIGAALLALVPSGWVEAFGSAFWTLLFLELRAHDADTQRGRGHTVPLDYTVTADSTKE